MKISIVLSTYNGEKYIEPLLDSLRRQTRPANEILISDDRSNDHTVEIINEYISLHKLSSWKVQVNENNLGWKKNFMQGIEKAEGDIVFFADQDDIWSDNKLDIMASVMEEEPSANLVLCNYSRFRDNECHFDLLSNTISRKAIKQNVTPHSNIVSHPGCTYCVRKSFFNSIKSAWIEDYPHDSFIYLAAWMMESIYLCEDTLVLFRRHDESVTTNSSVLWDRKERGNEVGKRRDIVSNLMRSVGKKMSHSTVHENYVTWLNLRRALLIDKKHVNVFPLLRYRDYYSSLLTWGVDLIVSYKP